jgi:uncharacterized membrane protein
MAVLILGLIVFLGVHSIRILADGWRTRSIAAIGAMPWKGLYALASLAGLVLVAWGFGLARAQPLQLWSPPAWMRHVTALLVLLAFVLVAAAYVPGTRIKAAIGHPMLAGVKTWALAHLLANGTLADLLLFGSFLLWAVAAFASSRRRDRAAGTRYAAAGTGRDIVAVAAGAAAWGWFAHFGHRWLIGVDPFSR